MAEELNLNPFITAPVKSALDLSPHQYKLVQYSSAGVKLAVASVGSGPGYVLMNDPKSGQACTLNVAGNITKAVAGTAMTLGVPVTVGASATCIATSATFLANSDGSQVLLMGYAESACSSGNIFNLRLV